jgi:hypothetical protein
VDMSIRIGQSGAVGDDRDLARGESVVRIAGHAMSPLVMLIVYIAIFATMLLLLLDHTKASLVVEGVLVVGLVWRGVRVVGIELDERALVSRRMFSQQRVRWSDIAAVEMRWMATRAGAGMVVTLVPAPGVNLRDVRLPDLARNAPERFAAFTEAHGVDVPLNPVEPWVDRFGTWHAPMLEFDPLESIRSIRRAAVGPYLVSIGVVPEGFQVLTKDERDGSTQRQSPPFERLDEATTEAIQQIRIAQSALSP